MSAFYSTLKYYRSLKKDKSGNLLGNYLLLKSFQGAPKPPFYRTKIYHGPMASYLKDCSLNWAGITKAANRICHEATIWFCYDLGQEV